MMERVAASAVERDEKLEELLRRVGEEIDDRCPDTNDGADFVGGDGDPVRALLVEVYETLASLRSGVRPAEWREILSGLVRIVDRYREEHGTWVTMDHACKECLDGRGYHHPEDRSLEKPGFRCAYHAAAHVLSAPGVQTERVPDDTRQPAVRAFVERVERRSRAIAAAEASLIQRVRELCEHRIGFQLPGGDMQYGTPPADFVDRLATALAELDRIGSPVQDGAQPMEET